MSDLRRVVFTAPGQAQVETVATDLTPAPEQVLLRTASTLISPGTELAVYTDTNDIGRDLSRTQYPAYPGYSAGGVIETAGTAVTSLAPGDSVMALTAHASHARFRPDRTVHLRLPPAFPLDYAPFVRMALIPLALLRQADLLAGEWLGVVGLGLVGNLGAQFGLRAGCGVIAVGRSELRNHIAAHCGIENIVTGEVESVAEATRSLTGGVGCRFVLETTGTPQGLQKAIALAGDGGTIALVGVPWQQQDGISASTIMQPVFSRYLSIIGGWEWGIPLFERDPDRPAPMISHRHSTEANARYAADCILRGVVQVEPLITHRINPQAIQSAYQGLLRQRDEYLGVLIRWDA